MINQDSIIKYHEQLPPQHNLAEEIILGGILVNKEIMQLAINELITESFSLETHQLIYRTINDIYLREKYIDSIILINTLWELNLLSHIGGIQKILDLLKQAQIFISTDLTYLTAQYYIYLIKDKYLRRLLIQYGYNIIKLAYVPSINSKNIFLKTDKYIKNIKYQGNQEIHSNVNSILTKFLIELKSNEYLGQKKNILSGFKGLDRISNGFEAGDLIVIAGRPSMGKTSLGLNITFNILQANNIGICIFSLEMSKEQILYKLLSMSSQIPVHQLQIGSVTNKDWTKVQESANKLVKSIIQIDDTANLSLNHLSLKAKNLKDKYPKIGIIMIDYLQLIQFQSIKSSNRAEELSIITRSLKILAKELSVPIIILSQLNRNVENRVNKIPMLSDLKESGCMDYYTKIIKYPSQNMPYTNWIYKDKSYTRIDLQDRLIHDIKSTSLQHKYEIHLCEHLASITTHNHLIFSHTSWKKVDHIKYKNSLNKSNQTATELKDAHIKFSNIRISLKNKSYDLVIPETQSILSNSGYILHNSIEQDADLVLMLYRESYYNSNNIDKSDKYITNLIVAKHRNGPTGTVELKFNPTMSSFDDMQ
uniref:Replicative DNA helicase n=1 Tax=Helminthocladia australis TaxID=260093 RepID=A0A1G4NTN2_9FLOR|nr:Replication helicase subunit [Helminthocladia australis]SCW22042.1 Replication helicase subunit [Helminthocladia australis]